MTEETGEEDKLLSRIVEEAVKSIFDQHFDPKQFRNIVEYFESGNTMEVGDRLPAAEVLKRIDAVSANSASRSQRRRANSIRRSPRRRCGRSWRPASPSSFSTGSIAITA